MRVVAAGDARETGIPKGATRWSGGVFGLRGRSTMVTAVFQFGHLRQGQAISPSPVSHRICCPTGGSSGSRRRLAACMEPPPAGPTRSRLCRDSSGEEDVIVETPVIVPMPAAGGSVQFAAATAMAAAYRSPDANGKQQDGAHRDGNRSGNTQR